ncbi:GL23118 [Drosophila persimilis]|uniref:GL23118 n=1 Tax=Drosophila persimilis TaxID=7234 RepID=B4G5R7_DROPE|nr:GL23118 [Drosophila persimilis]
MPQSGATTRTSSTTNTPQQNAQHQRRIMNAGANGKRKYVTLFMPAPVPGAGINLDDYGGLMTMKNFQFQEDELRLGLALGLDKCETS